MKDRATGFASARIRRELKTVKVMLEIYCRGHHDAGCDLCATCHRLWEYARRRVDRCPFSLHKPTCVHCTVHCFKPDMRDRIRAVMRYAGPRMLWRHPVLSLYHFLDGQPPPEAADGAPDGH